MRSVTRAIVRHWPRAAGVLGGLGVLLMLFATSSATTACQARSCEYSGSDFGRNPGEGRLIDANTWESTPAEGSWLPFPGERYWYFYPPFPKRKIARVNVFISPSADPNAGSQYTLASGNVAVIRQFADPGNRENPGISVGNDTCAEFFVRVVVDAYPAAADADASADAGADAAGDAGADASTDAAATDSASNASDGAPE